MNTPQLPILPHAPEEEQLALQITISIIRGSYYRTVPNAEFAIGHASRITKVSETTIKILLTRVHWDIQKYLPKIEV